MSIDVLIQGKLRGTTATKTASNGRPYTVFRMSAADKTGEGVLVSCIVFSESAQAALQRLDDGDSLCVSGDAAIKTWEGSDGTTRHGLDVTVHAVMTAYHAGRKRGEREAQGRDNDIQS